MVEPIGSNGAIITLILWFKQNAPPTNPPHNQTKLKKVKIYIVFVTKYFPSYNVGDQAHLS